MFITLDPQTNSVKEQIASIKHSKKRYDIKFDEYGILIWHPVTSVKNLSNDTSKLINFLKKGR